MKKIGDMIGKAMDRPEIMDAVLANRVLKQWEQVVGAAMAQRCAPDRFDRGVLWVAVEGSAWAQELRMNKGILLKKLNGISNSSLFKDIRFGVRAFKPITETSWIEGAVVAQVPDDREGLSIREIAERRLANYPDAPRD